MWLTHLFSWLHCCPYLPTFSASFVAEPQPLPVISSQLATNTATSVTVLMYSWSDLKFSQFLIASRRLNLVHVLTQHTLHYPAFCIFQFLCCNLSSHEVMSSSLNICNLLDCKEQTSIHRKKESTKRDTGITLCSYLSHT